MRLLVLVSFLTALTKGPDLHNHRGGKVYWRAHSFRSLSPEKLAPFLGA